MELSRPELRAASVCYPRPGGQARLGGGPVRGSLGSEERPAESCGPFSLLGPEGSTGSPEE